MKRISLFVLISFGFSWTIAAFLANTGGLSHAWAGAFLFAFMCGPAVGALVCTALFNKGHRLQALGLKGNLNLWIVWAWLIGLAIVLGATLISLLSPQVSFQAPVEGVKQIAAQMGQDVGDSLDIPGINFILLAQAAILGSAINLPLMLSEELGWRGWLWSELRPKGFWTVTFWTGLLWGLWHVPIVYMGHNYPGMPLWGPVLFTVFCLLYTPIYSWIREKSGSVWAACALHGTGNAMAGIGLMAQTNTDMPWRGVVGIGGFVMLILLTVFVAWSRKTNPMVTAEG